MERVLAGASGAEGGPDDADAVFILQHPPVYTLGAGSTTDHLRFDPAHPPAPLYRTERGGEVTYHGPGQLVVYPILNLARHKQARPRGGEGAGRGGEGRGGHLVHEQARPPPLGLAPPPAPGNPAAWQPGAACSSRRALG
jgi:hypothetical protein